MALEDLTAQDYLEIFQRRWRLAIVGAVIGAIAGISLAKLQTPAPIYEATATIGYDPRSGFEVATGENLPQQSMDMTAQQILIRSTPILGRAARQLSLIPKDTPPEQFDRYLGVIVDLRAQVDVMTDPARRTGMMGIRARAPLADEAANIANAVAGAFKEANLLELKKFTVKRREFIENQLSENEKGLNAAQLAYEHFRREHPRAAIEPGMQGMISDVAQREAKAADVASKIDEVRRQLTLVRSGRPVSDLGLQTIVGGAATARLTQLSTSYTQLNLEKSRLLTELTEAHPAVRQKIEQIEGVRSDLETELHLILEAFEKQEEEATAKIDEVRQKEESLPEEAMQLSHLARQVKTFENLGLQLRQQLEETLLRDAGVVGQVTLMTPASVPDVPLNAPAYIRLGLLGAFGGLFAGFVLAVLIQTAQFSPQTLREIEESLELSVLGVSPSATPETLSAWLPSGQKLRQDTPEWSRSLALAGLLAPRSPLSEAFRTLRTGLQARLAAGPVAFTVGASSPGEGSTTTAINLALSFAQTGQSVLLVESDLRNPTISAILGLPSAPGLVDFLLGGCTLEQATRGVADFVMGSFSLDEILLGPGLDQLHVMPCGQLTSNTGELFGSAAFAAAMATLRSRYQVIVFDSPALTASADCILLGKQSKVIFVFSPRQTKRSELEGAVTQVRESGCTLAGLFVNRMDMEVAAPETEPKSAKAAP